VSCSTKEFLGRVGISESTLRRWLSEDRIPQLKNVKRDWKGWRIWEDEHVEAILEYKKRRLLSLKKREGET
jgi:predicted site-specific integrase-resolvase